MALAEVGTGLFELGLELLGAGAVLGGFGAGDVDERLEVGGGDGGGVGVLLELGFERGGALGGLLGLLVELFLEAVDLGAGLGGSILGAAGVVLCFLKLRLELRRPGRSHAAASSAEVARVCSSSVWSCSARSRCLGGFGG